MNIPPDNSNDFYATFLNGVRKYAPYFALSASREDDEISVPIVLSQELTKRRRKSFHSVVLREKGQDPPDCEARDNYGKRIGIEVTELVDGDSISATKKGEFTSHICLTSLEAISTISTIIRKKDRADVKGGPYDEYVLII